MGQTRPVRLRYTLPALADLSAILDYIAARSPQGARRVQARIKAITDLLPLHPLYRTPYGRSGDPPDGRDALPLSHFLRGHGKRDYHSRHPARRPRPIPHARLWLRLTQQFRPLTRKPVREVAYADRWGEAWVE